MGWLAKRSHTVSEALTASSGEIVSLLGWVSSKSSLGGMIFLRLRDGSGEIQLNGKKGATPEGCLSAMEESTKESAIWAKGELREDRRAPGGKEVLVKDFAIIAKAEKWPITKSAIKSSSFLYDLRHLSIRGRKATAIMRIRAELIRASFEFFSERGFVLISAPTIVQAAVEGGATLFPIDYFGEQAYLSQSAQFYEEAAICSLEKVFVFQPAFRAEKSKTSKHLTEFWMIEAEQAFADQEDNLKLQEDLLTYVVSRIVERRKEELQLLGRKVTVPDPPFPRISYDEVRSFASNKGLEFTWGDDIPTEVERLVSSSMEGPFFITDYPLSARSFYHKTREDDDRITLSADLMAPEGYGEIATGGQRIDDYKTLLKRIEAQDLPAHSFQWYLDLRRYGMPPHSGFGIGVERTLRWICGLKHIRAASLFPRTIKRVYP